MAPGPHVRSETRGGVRRITLDRPDSGNRITEPLALAFIDAVRRAVEDDEVSVVVVAGSGGVFSLGAEATLAEIGAESAARRGVAAAAASLAKPVIAAINGDAIGQGLELALACDLRVMSAEARLALDQIGRGELPWDGGTQRLPRLIPRSVASEMVLLGRALTADEALRCGLVSQVAPPADVEARAMELAERLTSAAPIANAYAKEAILAGMDLPLEQGLRLEADLAVLLHASRDRDEGIRAFLEKRPPKFTGG